MQQGVKYIKAYITLNDDVQYFILFFLEVFIGRSAPSPAALCNILKKETHYKRTGWPKPN